MDFKKKCLLVLIVLSLKMTAQSPEWAPAGMPLYGWNVFCIYSDTVNSTLYATGGILNSPTSFSNYYICKYNGSSWSILGAFNDHIYSLTTYNGELIAAGFFTSVNGIPAYSIAKYDGTTWQPLGNFDNGIFRIKVINSDLYAVGYFSTIDGVPRHRVAKWNGAVWSDVYGFSLDSADCILYDIEVYNGNTYVCGNFVDGTLGINHLAVYKGGTWQNVGGGILGGWTDLVKMVIYHNELHLLGCILKPAGNVGNGIQKWNDTAWSEVGAGVQDFSNAFGSPGTIIHDGIVHNNELYVVGSFGYAGHIPAYCAAKWDGTKWCGLATTGLLSNRTMSINFFNDTLYMGIANDTLNGVYTNRIIKYLAGSYVDTCSINFTGINEIINPADVTIYPNPASSIITIESTKHQVQSIRIMDVLGQEIYYLQTTNSKTEIDVSQLPSGIYILQMQSKNGVQSKKFVKE